MNDATSANEPLSPEALQVAARMRRMMLISALTTGIGIAAVFGVIGYRIFKGEGSAAAPAAETATVTVPRGARVVATTIADGRLIVTLEAGGVYEIRSLDAKTLKQTGQVRFISAP